MIWPMRLSVVIPTLNEAAHLPTMLRGGLIADAVAVISSIDPVMGEVDR